MRGPQTVMQALRWATKRLADAGIEDARLEARVLLEGCLDLTRTQLHLNPYRVVQPDDLGVFHWAVERRIAGEPLAYIVGHKEFFGLDFTVDPRVLVPRPETELLVEEALAILEKRRAHSPAPCVVDVGTGCGAIAISLAKRCPEAFVYALDASADALAVAELNARRHEVDERLAFLQGDLLDPLDEPADLIAANLPYVTTADLERAQPEVRREPRLALDGGPDGLDVYRRLLAQAPAHLRPGGALLMEIGAEQGAAAAELARLAFPGAALRLRQDLAGLDRVVVVELEEPIL